jgi:hypothetical protein
LDSDVDEVPSAEKAVAILLTIVETLGRFVLIPGISMFAWKPQLAS